MYHDIWYLHGPIMPFRAGQFCPEGPFKIYVTVKYRWYIDHLLVQNICCTLCIVQNIVCQLHSWSPGLCLYYVSIPLIEEFMYTPNMLLNKFYTYMLITHFMKKLYGSSLPKDSPILQKKLQRWDFRLLPFVLWLTRGRILGHNCNKSLKSFPPCYSQSLLLTDFTPPPLSPTHLEQKWFETCL
jgi:hypothetical protein